MSYSKFLTERDNILSPTSKRTLVSVGGLSEKSDITKKTTNEILNQILMPYTKPEIYSVNISLVENSELLTTFSKTNKVLELEKGSGFSIGSYNSILEIMSNDITKLIFTVYRKSTDSILDKRECLINTPELHYDENDANKVISSILFVIPFASEQYYGSKTYDDDYIKLIIDVYDSKNNITTEDFIVNFITPYYKYSLPSDTVINKEKFEELIDAPKFNNGEEVISKFKSKTSELYPKATELSYPVIIYPKYLGELIEVNNNDYSQNWTKVLNIEDNLDYFTSSINNVITDYYVYKGDTSLFNDTTYTFILDINDKSEYDYIEISGGNASSFKAID